MKDGKLTRRPGSLGEAVWAKFQKRIDAAIALDHQSAKG